MGLTTPLKVQKLQAALHAKAKGSPGYRFYALYDKVCRRDVLAFAYARCKANRGAAGVDDQSFAAFEERHGASAVLDREPVAEVADVRADNDLMPLCQGNGVFQMSAEGEKGFLCGDSTRPHAARLHP